MAISKILHKRSKTLGHLPNGESLDYGEIAINYAKGSEMISIKNSADEVVSFKVASDGKNMKEVTYAELKELKDGNKLTSGMMYRITDYVCTAKNTESQPDVKALNHQFDIIVTAIDDHTLNENALAAHHSGDTYFAKSNLDAWQLKYSFENDVKRFDWADTESGKGVIYYMKDEWGNECPYDFKNIQFARVKVKAKEGYENLSALTGTYVGIEVLLENDYQKGLEQDGSDKKYFYTFHATDTKTNAEQDATVEIYTNSDLCANNIIKPCYYYLADGYDWYNKNIMMLPNIIFLNEHYAKDGDNNGLYYKCIGNTFSTDCYNNTFRDSCYNNTFGDSCNSNTFGTDCESNTFGDSCEGNTFGNSCYYNSFGERCYYNTFGNDFLYNSFVNYCGRNTFGRGCQSNTFGSNCNSNTFGNGCYRNTLGGNCNSNTFGNDCESNIFGNSCESNTFGSGFNTNTFGGSCSGNSFGNDCYSNSFGNGCNGNTFRDGCYSNTFGNSCESNTFGEAYTSNTFGNSCYENTFGDDCAVNTLGDGCSYNTFGYGCESNVFGNNCYYNTFGDSAYYNSVGNGFNSNTFENACSYNSFGNQVQDIAFIGGIYRYNIVENGVKCVDVKPSSPTTVRDYVKNFVLSQGMEYSYTVKKTISVPINSDKKIVYTNGGIDYIDTTLTSDKFIGIIDGDTF